MLMSSPCIVRLRGDKQLDVDDLAGCQVDEVWPLPGAIGEQLLAGEVHLPRRKMPPFKSASAANDIRGPRKELKRWRIHDPGKAPALAISAPFVVVLSQPKIRSPARPHEASGATVRTTATRRSGRWPKPSRWPRPRRARPTRKAASRPSDESSGASRESERQRHHGGRAAHGSQRGTPRRRPG